MKVLILWEKLRQHDYKTYIKNSVHKNSQENSGEEGQRDKEEVVFFVI